MLNKFIFKLIISVLLLSIFTPLIKVECDELIYYQEWIDHNKNKELDKYEDKNLPVEERIRDLLSRMTLEEKIGQLLQYPEPYLREGEEFSSDNARELIKDHKVGSLLKNLVGSTSLEWAKISNEIQRIALEETRLGIPIIIGDDIIHGYAMLKGATVLPVRLAQAATWNPDLVQKGASMTAKESRSVGTHWAFAPTLSVVRDPRWGRTEETFGEDPYLVGDMGVAIVKGYQGETLNSSGSILAGPKHFAGDGEPMGGRNADLIDISERNLREVILPPFKAAVEAGAGNIMAAHHAVNNVPCHANSKLLNDILRGEWGFDGFVVSDWTDIERIYQLHNTATTVGEAGKKAIEAGVDMDMVGGWREEPAFGKPLLRLVEKGEVSNATIDRAVSRILRYKFRLGLFEEPYVETEMVNRIVNSREHKELAYRMACESMVLLKNEGNLLPLDKEEIKSIAVIGPSADNLPHQLGDWTSREPREMVSTILDGIEDRVSSGTEIHYVEGCKVLGVEEKDFDNAVDAAKKFDVAIVVVGGASERYNWEKRTCGENVDRAQLGLPGVQEELIKEIYKTGVPLILVLINGRPLTINWATENIPSILEACYPGQEGGFAVADVLFGNYNPGGKLPITFPRCVGHIPIYYNMERGRVRQYSASGEFNEFRPLYPFGHGLSYTKFEYSELKITPEEKIKPDEILEISLKVRNIGDYKGDEIVQLYIKDRFASVVRPIKELKAYKRITLKKGEERQLTFKLPIEHLSFYNLENKLVVEPGEFEVLIGSSSEDIRLNGSFKVLE